MNARPQRGRDGADSDWRTGQQLARWFAEHAPTAVPETLVPNVSARVRATRRRSGWRIRDWWQWRPQDRRRSGWLLVTATGVLVVALTGLGSVGIGILATIGQAHPASMAPGAAVGSPDMAAVSPSAAAEAPATLVADGPTQTQATAVAGTLADAPVMVAEGVATVSADGVTEIAGVTTSGTLTFDDARLTGTQRSEANERRYGISGEGSLATGTMSIENDAGTWAGTYVRISPPGREGSLLQAELVGEGAYEGLSAILRYDLAKPWGDAGMVAGVVYPGTLPDYPSTDAFAPYEPYWDGPDPLAPDAAPEPDGASLPVGISGSMEQSVEWMSDDVLFDLDEAGMQLAPEWMVAKTRLSDPRLAMSDYQTLTNTVYFEALENGAAVAGISRGSSGANGGWSGPLRGYADPEDEYLSGFYSVTELSGSGAYEGLTAVLFATPQSATTMDYFLSWSVEGMLLEGELPPYLEGP
jgi:hypothetical protein